MLIKLKKRITLLLKKWPALYHLVAQAVYTLRFRYWTELLFGTKVREKEWVNRHLHGGNDWGNKRHVGEGDEWVLGYWDSRDHGHRPFLLEKISSFAPLSSILEIGCNCGPNLYLVAKRFPDAQIRGIDINPRVIQKGNELFAAEGILNVELSIGKVDDLGQFDDNSFDIVLTDALLMYIGRDKIEQTIQEMARVARRALIMTKWHWFEPQPKDKHGLGTHWWGCWRRDYEALLRRFVPEEQVRISKITKDIWPDDRWSEAGAVIEVVLDVAIIAQDQLPSEVQHKLGAN